MFLISGIAAVACASRPYVLPSADGGSDPSPPTLEGRILKAGPGMLTVETKAAAGIASTAVAFRLTTTTEIFTVHGGRVQPSGLVPGLRVRVWLPRPGIPRPGETEEAAAIMIASKDPKDEWP